MLIANTADASGRLTVAGAAYICLGPTSVSVRVRLMSVSVRVRPMSVSGYVTVRLTPLDA